MKTAVLLYQGGIANVFDVDGCGRKFLKDSNRDGRPVRLLQGAFRECEAFARGLERACVVVYSMHANYAGDAANTDWSVELDEAPFRENMRPVGSFVDPIQKDRR